MKRSTLARATLALSGLTLGLGVACSAKTLPYAGGIMVAVQTDLSAPKDVAALGLYITSDGRPIFGDTREVAPNGDVKFPATLAVLADSNRPRAVVKIRAVAFRADGSVRVLRDIVTTIPKGRTGLLRVPLIWINEGSGQGDRTQLLGSASLRPLDATADGFTRLTSACPDGQTFIEGECADAHVDGDSLPEYVEADVFGGGNAAGSGGRCFDTAQCFADRVPVNIDLTSCTGTVTGVDPNDPNLSMAVVLPSSAATGECLADGICLVPLDKELVWKVSGNAVAFPQTICKRIASGQATTVLATRKCLGKDAMTPLCGPASAVATKSDVGNDGGGVSAADFDAPIVSKRAEALLSDVAIDNQYIFLARAQSSLPAGVVRLRKSDITTLTQPEDFQVLFNYGNGVEEASKIALDSTTNATQVVAHGQSGAIHLCTPASLGDCPSATVPWPTFRLLAASASEAFVFGAVTSVTGLWAVPYAAPVPEQRQSASNAAVSALIASGDSLYMGLEDGSIQRCVMPCKGAADLSQVQAPTAAPAPVTALAATDKVPGKLFAMRLPIGPQTPNDLGGVFMIDKGNGAEQKLAALEELFGPIPSAEPPSALAVDSEYVYWGGGFDDPRDNTRKGGLIRRSHRTLAVSTPFFEATQGGEFVTAVVVDDTHVFWTYYRADRSLLFAKKARSF